MFFRPLEAARQLTTCLCFVAVIQGHIDLHDRHVLDLNSQPKRGLDQDVKGRGTEYVDVTLVVTRNTRNGLFGEYTIYLFIYLIAH